MGDVAAYTRLASVYDEIVVDQVYSRWAGYLRELWDSDPSPVRTVLDVGCGTGLLAAELVASGHTVVGVDSSAAMLARARERLGPHVELAERNLPDLSDLSDLSADGLFDAVVSTFDVLNYLEPVQLRDTADAVADHLRPGGWFVFDLHTDTMMDFAVANPRVSGLEMGTRFTISNIVDVSGRTCDTTVTVTRQSDGESFTEQHRQYFHSDADVRRALAEAGLSLDRVTDEYTAEPVVESTLRATWVARLPTGPAPSTTPIGPRADPS
jgi:SAM-dependent methyltransferase